LEGKHDQNTDAHIPVNARGSRVIEDAFRL